MITGRALHEITKPVCSGSDPITACNYSDQPVIPAPQALQIGPVITCNADLEILSLSSGSENDPQNGQSERGALDMKEIDTPVISPLADEDAFGLPVADLAWAAGFFDGEGCIIGVRTSSPRGPQYVLTVTVGQVDRRPLDYLAELFGGGVRLQKSATETTQQLHVWSVSDGYARNFLKSVRPYLRVKGERADLALRSGAMALYDRPNRRTTLAARRLREEG